MIQYGLRMDEEAAYRELQEVIAEFTSNYSSHFDKLLIRLPKERYYPDSNPVMLIAAGVIGYHETKSIELRPFPDVITALRRLAKTNLRLGIVSAGLQAKQAEIRMPRERMVALERAQMRCWSCRLHSRRFPARLLPQLHIRCRDACTTSRQ